MHHVGGAEAPSSQLVRRTKRLVPTLFFNNLLNVAYVCRG
ncbi:hypothetical protein [Escherichia phage EC120]|nr:hypothetical protein [Escherichia phage EC120]